MAHRRDTTARRQELFEEAAAIIAFEYAEPLTLDEVARRLFTSPRQLQRAFAEAGDGSFRSHLCRIRMERASDLLRDGAKVAEAAHAVGYSQPAQFAKAFRRYRPLSPSAVRHRHAPAARMAETRPRRSSASSSKPTPSRHSSRGISTLAPPIVAKDSARVSHPWGRNTLLASAGSRPIEVSRAPALGTSAQMEAVAPEKLQSIEHIVVLQLENRSFDHMLGYLALVGNELPAHGELDNVVNGFGGEPNSFKGVLYPPEPLDEDAFDRHDLDPPHGADEVERQIAGGTMSGFVEEWARKLHKKSGWTRWAKRAWAKLRRRPYPDPAKLRAVVGYVTREKVPVFDHLARHFCVCDNWFCAVPGPTMPNRFFSVAGTHDGEMSNVKLLVHKAGSFKSLFRELHSPHAWRWYSSDPGILRAIDEDYRLDTDPRYDHFAYFDEFTERQPRTFLSDVLRDGELPEVAWIDPNFAIRDMVKLIGPLLDGPGSNDDHPPSRVIEAQRLVNKVYEALGRSRYWDNTLFVTYYDEHGGFHDHQEPPAGMGPRIPALLVGGRVKRGVFHKQLDHASLIKTILLRFGTPGSIGRMPERVAAATDLSGALRDDNEVVPFRPLPNGGPVAITEKNLEPRMLEEGASRATRTIEFLEKALTDLQALMVKYHALPLRTGRRTLSRLPTRRLAKLAIEVAPDKPEKERLPPRRP